MSTMDTEELIKTLSEDAAPVKRLPPAPLRVVKWLLAVAGVLLAGLALLGLRDDVIQRMADPMFLLESGLITIAGLTAALAAFRLGRPDVEVGVFNKVLIFISGGIWVLLNVYCFYCTEPEAITRSATAAHEAKCLTEIALFGLPAGLVIFAMIRRAAPVHFAWAGLAAALAVLSFTALGGRYTCANMDFSHILVWHFFPVILLGAAGMWAGKKYLNW